MNSKEIKVLDKVSELLIASLLGVYEEPTEVKEAIDLIDHLKKEHHKIKLDK